MSRSTAAGLTSALAALLASCSPATPAAPPAPTSATVLASRLPWADSVLATLSLRDKAAQMTWPSVIGNYASETSPQGITLRRWVTEDHIGGITVSLGSPLEIADKLNALQRMSTLPLLVGADLEFGAGYIARGGFAIPNAIDLGGAVVFPPEMAIGATRDTSLAYEQGRITAREGRALGIHIAYAPILDVNNNPANPVINTRSYGEDPRLDARLGASFVRGLQEHGMIATGKHFPGHGDTGTNSHLALPVVVASRARLDTVELVPFRAAVNAGVGAIMTFHGAMPALDSTGVPGTLSPRVLGGVLRGELGFRGIIISDAMDMRGVLDQFGAVEATKRAVAAGADVLIQPLDVRQTIDAIVAGVNEGRYTEARLDSSVRRILNAKQSLGLGRQRLVALDSVRALVGDTSNAAVARTAAERSITIIRDSLRALPLRLTRTSRVLSVTVARRGDLYSGSSIDAELRRAVPGLRSIFVNADDPGSSYASALATADSMDAVIVGTYLGHAWSASSIAAPTALVDFLRELRVRGSRRGATPPVLVSFGNPYFLQQVPFVPMYVIAWGGFPVSQQAAARAIIGAIPVGGRLPIAIPPYAKIGEGEQRAALP